MLQFQSHPTFSITITAEIGSGAANETIKINMPLTRPLKSFLRHRHLRMCDQFHRFHLVGPKHIAADLGLIDKVHVHESIAQVARMIQFMDHTSLVPTSEEIYGVRTFSKDLRLPGQDHATIWRDPGSNSIVMLDEPYGYVDDLFPERKLWAARNGLIVHRLQYKGTYRPGCGIVCDLVYRAEQRKFAKRIIDRVEKIDSLPKIEDLGRAYLDV